ncbi:DNRLRE domain-containing protein [Nonomuraea sp. bgisy101]|uniref:DNRLRE domain-containing protein n=1 Tax=Nonomuraea sp. bgisy101 TaxID=3413784 RepID=UPI003D736C42
MKANGKRKRKERRFGLKWAGQLGKPEVFGSTMTWRNVAPGADLIVQAQARGFVHFVVLRERPSGPMEIKLPIELSGMKFAKRADRGLQLSDDSSNKVIAAAPAPQMWDAAAEQSPDAGKRAEVASEIVNGSDGPVFMLKPDAAFLADPNVQFPVTVDPWMQLTLQTDTFVSTDYPNSQTGATWLHAGKFGSGAKTARTYLQFGLNGMNRKHILNADLVLSNYKANACGTAAGAGIQARRVTSAWTSSTLNLSAQPSTSATNAVPWNTWFGVRISAAENVAVTWPPSGSATFAESVTGSDTSAAPNAGVSSAGTSGMPADSNTISRVAVLPSPRVQYCNCMRSDGADEGASRPLWPSSFGVGRTFD